MENVILTQLSIPEIRQIFRQELECYFKINPIATAIEEDGNQLLNIQQAAELLNLAVPTIYGLVSRAEIPYSKKGKKLYFTKQELLDWVQSGRKKTTSEIQTEATNYINHKSR